MTDNNPAQPLTVLVADDTSANRNLMQLFLRKLGFDSVCAKDGQEAVEMFEQSRPDAVLMDLMMPRMDGFEATRRIRSVQGRVWTPIIIMSALNTDADIVAGLDAGADDYLVKPVSFPVFAAKMRTMQRLLAMERGQRELLGRMQAISNAVIDALLTIDEAGTIHSANPATHRIFGYPAGALVGRNVGILLPGDGAGASLGALPGVVGKVREMAGVRANGEVFPLELGLTELKLDERHLYIGVMRDISERMRAQAEREQHAAHLQRYHDEQQREQELARQIMASQINLEALRDARIHYAVMPAQNFSGDLVVAATSPGGRLYAMLADATGHGLSAAVSVQPVLPVFYALVAGDVSLAHLVGELNRQLHASLPVGRFVGAAIVSLEADGRQASVWIGGIPAALVVSAEGRVRRRVESRHLPLGIIASSREGSEPETVLLAAGEQLALYSDGVIEAGDESGEAFGLPRLEQALANPDPAPRLEAVRQALQAHLGSAAAHDDMSLLLIDAKAMDSHLERIDPII
jgi:PAS domain S-box-containing protein